MSGYTAKRDVAMVRQRATWFADTRESFRDIRKCLVKRGSCKLHIASYL